MKLPDKYDGPGIYYIMIYQHIVYIGQSVDMQRRVQEHKSFILNPNRIKARGPRNKYKQLNRAYNHGESITFGVLYKGDDLDYMEAYYIDQYQPVFNYEIPQVNNQKHKLINKRAYMITLEDMLEGEWQFCLENEGYQWD